MKRAERDWTIVQMFYHDPVEVSERHPMGWAHREETFVAETPYKSHAEKIVADWLLREGVLRYGPPEEVHYYPRNYVDLRDDLVAAGRVIR